MFHNKILRGFLKLSQTSPIPALFFLLGELPAEGVLHIRTLSLLQNIWSNPTSTVYSMVEYILKMCSMNSTTWSNHVQLLCIKYGLPSPLSLLKSSPTKPTWNTMVKTKVTIWHEKELKRISAGNSKMQYLNVQLLSLSGRPHPVLHNISTTQDAKKLRLRLKFLTCDFLTSERLAIDQPSLSPACKLCSASIDSIEHVMVSCPATSEVRSRLIPDLMNAVFQVQPMCQILKYHPPPSILTQFILDCTSFNLPDSVRIPMHNPGISTICKVSRDWCFAVSRERSRLHKQLVQLKPKTTGAAYFKK